MPRYAPKRNHSFPSSRARSVFLRPSRGRSTTTQAHHNSRSQFQINVQTCCTNKERVLCYDKLISKMPFRKNRDCFYGHAHIRRNPTGEIPLQCISTNYNARNSRPSHPFLAFVSFQWMPVKRRLFLRSINVCPLTVILVMNARAL